MSYGPGRDFNVMTLLDLDTGAHVAFRVSDDEINQGAKAFNSRILEPAMVALDRRRHAGVSDFPTISLKPMATHIDG